MRHVWVLLMIAVLAACGAEVTVDAPPACPGAGGVGGVVAACGGCGGTTAPLGGQGGTGAQGGEQPAAACQRQSDCVVGDGQHDICYTVDEMYTAHCLLGDTIYCEVNDWCWEFGWCDLGTNQCRAESADKCLVYGELVDCAASGEICCEHPNGQHDCTSEEFCTGTVLEP